MFNFTHNLRISNQNNNETTIDHQFCKVYKKQPLLLIRKIGMLMHLWQWQFFSVKVL